MVAFINFSANFAYPLNEFRWIDRDHAQQKWLLADGREEWRDL